MAEATVKIIKTSTSKTRDTYTPLVAYKTTPLRNYSPPQLLTGRRLCTELLMAPKLLLPGLPDVQPGHKFEQADKESQRKAYDRRHHDTQDLHDTFDREDAWVADLKKGGTVVQAAAKTRSCIINTGGKVVRRNQTHLVPLPQADNG